jgi:ComF family protein
LPAASFALPGERGRLVFSSSEDPIRATGTQVLTRDSSLVSMLVSSVSGVAESLFATLFPSDCRLCGSPLINISRLPVCRPCLADCRPITGIVCSVCGERVFTPYALSAAETRCGLCRRMEQPFVRAIGYGSYDGGLRELIHLLKYEQVRPAATVLGRMLAEAMTGLQAGWTGNNPLVVVPVPLHSRKLRQRGFNQSELIAQHAIKLVAGSGRLVLHSRVLERRRETQSQIGLTRHQRRQNLRGAFVVSRPEEIAGREIVLVDDVFTTGTTVSECARVLRQAGASKVFVATVARTLKYEVKGINLTQILAEDERILAATG